MDSDRITPVNPFARIQRVRDQSDKRRRRKPSAKTPPSSPAPEPDASESTPDASPPAPDTVRVPEPTTGPTDDDTPRKGGRLDVRV